MSNMSVEEICHYIDKDNGSVLHLMGKKSILIMEALIKKINSLDNPLKL